MAKDPLFRLFEGTLFELAPTLSDVALGGLSAAGAILEASSKSKTAEANARKALQDAARERGIARREETQFRREQSRRRATSRAVRAASGVRTDTGTPLLVDRQIQAEIELGAETIRRGGQARATSLEEEARLQRLRGRSAVTAGAFGVGRSLLAGLGRGFR